MYIPYTITLDIIIYTDNRGDVHMHYLYVGSLIFNKKLTPNGIRSSTSLVEIFYSALNLRTFYIGFVIYKNR